MNIEEIETIMQAVQTLGDTGFYAFLAYLGVKVLINLMVFVTFCSFIYFCYRGLMRLITAERAIEELRDLLNIGTPGPITPAEFQRTVARLKELASKA